MLLYKPKVNSYPTANAGWGPASFDLFIWYSLKPWPEITVDEKTGIKNGDKNW